MRARHAEYRHQVAEQDGMCAICGARDPQTGRRFAADHCHATGTRRELLCHPCNIGLGMFKDDPEVLRKAADYLEYHRVLALPIAPLRRGPVPDRLKPALRLAKGLAKGKVAA